MSNKMAPQKDSASTAMIYEALPRHLKKHTADIVRIVERISSSPTKELINCLVSAYEDQSKLSALVREKMEELGTNVAATHAQRQEIKERLADTRLPKQLPPDKLREAIGGPTVAPTPTANDGMSKGSGGR